MAILSDLATMPVSSVIIAICCGVWFYEWNSRVDYDSVGISYNKFARQGQYWRIVSASFSHLDFMHLAFNMGSLYKCGVIETAQGSLFYLQNSILLIFLSMVITMGIYHFALYRLGRDEYMNSLAVGYSCVVFGWMTILSQYQPDYAISLPGNIRLPISVMPFVSLVVTQLIVRRASFIGHFSGIIAGLLVGWGLFSWVTPYWFLTSLGYLVLFMLISLKTTTTVPVPFVTVPGEHRGGAHSIRGGVLRAHNTRLVGADDPTAADDWV